MTRTPRGRVPEVLRPLPGRDRQKNNRAKPSNSRLFSMLVQICQIECQGPSVTLGCNCGSPQEPLQGFFDRRRIRTGLLCDPRRLEMSKSVNDRSNQLTRILAASMQLLYLLFSLMVAWWPFCKTRSTVRGTGFPGSQGGPRWIDVCLWLPIVGWIPLQVCRHDGWLLPWRVVGFGDDVPPESERKGGAPRGPLSSAGRRNTHSLKRRQSPIADSRGRLDRDP